jgi:hypothetical protein
MRLPKLGAFAGMLALAAPTTAQLRPSPLGDIYESYNDCFKVATKDGMDPNVLGSLGWSRATVSSKDGNKADSQPIIYGHTKRAPLILLTVERGNGLCIIMARLKNSGSFEEFKKAWGGKLPAPDAQGAISFSAEGHVVQLRQTGSAQEPSLSIAVMTPVESK